MNKVHDARHRKSGAAILVSVEPEKEMQPYAREELIALTETAVLRSSGEFHQKRDRPHAAFFIGPGKTESSMRGSRMRKPIWSSSIANSPRPGSQPGRGGQVPRHRPTQLILDIFAQRAQTREGKLQVSLAS